MAGVTGRTSGVGGRAVSLATLAGLLVWLLSGCAAAPGSDAAAVVEARPSADLELPPPPTLVGQWVAPLRGEARDRARLPLEEVLARRHGEPGPAAAPSPSPDTEAEPSVPADADGFELAASAAAVKHYAAGRDALRQERFRDALDQLSQAVAADPAAAGPRLLLGQLYLEIGQVDAAEQALRAAARRDADRPMTGYLLGRIHFERQEHEAALRWLARASASVTRRPADPALPMLIDLRLGQVLLRLGHDAAAVEPLERFLRASAHPARSTRLYTQVRAAADSRRTVRLQVGDAYMRLGRPDLALTHYTESDKPDDAGAEAEPIELARLSRLAYAMLMLDRDAAAIERFVEALPVDPPVEPYAELARYIAAHAPADRLRTALRQNYERSEGTPFAARLLLTVLRPEEVEAFLSTHLAAHPEHEALRQTQLQRLARRSPAEAVRVALESWRGEGDEPPPFEALVGLELSDAQWSAVWPKLPQGLADSAAAWYLRGRVAQRGGRFDDARAAYAAAIERDPDLLAAQLTMIELRLAAGDPAAALERVEDLNVAASPRLAYLQARAQLELARREGAEDDGRGDDRAENRLNQAIFTANRLLSAEPGHPEYRLLRAEILRARGSVHEAETELKAILRADPGYTPAYAELFEIYEQQRNAAAFRQLLALAQNRIPHTRLTRLKTALVEAELGRLDRAESLLRDLREADPDDPEVARALVDVLIRGERYDEATSLLLAWLDRDPDARAALHLLHRVGEASGDLELFHTRYLEYLQRQPATLGNELEIAWLEATRGEVDQAVDRVRSALADASPVEPRQWLRAVKLLADYDRLTEAMDLLRRSMEREEISEGLVLQFAMRVAEEGSADAALAMLDLVLERGFPNDVIVKRLKAQVLGRAGRLEEAMAVIRPLVARNPQPKADAIYEEAAFAHDPRSPQLAERLLRWVLEEDPDHIPANNDLSYLWAERGVHLEQAERMARKAVDAEPDSAAYLDTLGWVLYKRGEFAAAQQWLAKAADAPRGSDPIILDHLGDAHWRLGEREQAERHWRQALRMVEAMIEQAGPRVSPDHRRLLPQVRAKLEAASRGEPPDLAPTPSLDGPAGEPAAAPANP